MSEPSGERVLVLLPTARDGERTRRALAGAGVECQVCADLASLCREIERGAGTALLTEEAVLADQGGHLAQVLHAQPPWSDFPLVVLAREDVKERGHLIRESLNASLVERPVKLRSLLSVVRAALRSRRHQYAVRDQMAERLRAEAELQRAHDELERRVAERTAELTAALEILEQEMTRRRDLARRLSTAQEDERRRVSRDLHDSVGQLLAGLSLTFKSIESGGNLPPLAADRLAEAQRVLNDLGREVHGLAVRLRPTSLDDVGLEPALGQLVAEWSSRSGVKAAFHAARSGHWRLPAEVETTVYRVVQEALTNVAKHAKASAVDVVVTRPDGFVSLVVEDDGAGFDPDSPPKGRLGLLGMRERVELVGGTIEIESSPGSGTTVAAQIPVSPPEVRREQVARHPRR